MRVRHRRRGFGHRRHGAPHRGRQFRGIRR